MSAARDDVLANIRRALGVTGKEAPRRSAVADRIAQAPRGVIPARGQVTGPTRIAIFRTQAEKAAATVAVVAAASDVPEEAARFLRDSNLPATLRRGADARLATMPWDRTAITLSAGHSGGDDLNAISHAVGGIVESGTLALVSGPDNPTSLNFLPDNHIVVVAEEDLAGDYETLFARINPGHGAVGLPRSINLVTGPSRSADIEQTLIVGAHGPRRLHVIVVAT